MVSFLVMDYLSCVNRYAWGVLQRVQLVYSMPRSPNKRSTMLCRLQVVASANRIFIISGMVHNFWADSTRHIGMTARQNRDPRSPLCCPAHTTYSVCQSKPHPTRTRTSLSILATANYGEYGESITSPGHMQKWCRCSLP